MNWETLFDPLQLIHPVIDQIEYLKRLHLPNISPSLLLVHQNYLHNQQWNYSTISMIKMRTLNFSKKKNLQSNTFGINNHHCGTIKRQKSFSPSLFSNLLRVNHYQQPNSWFSFSNLGQYFQHKIHFSLLLIYYDLLPTSRAHSPK